jgi:hypothetical protein
VKVLACSAVLATALAGCGGSSQKPAALSTSAAASSGTTSASSAASSSSVPTTSAPTTSAPPSGTGQYAAFPGFTPPSDLKNFFDPTPSTGNAVKDAILADDVQAELAFDVWSTTGDFKTPGVSTYLGTAIEGEFAKQTAQYHAAGKVPGGTTRYYNRKVTALSSQSATVIDCEDGRQNYDKIAKTGQQVPGSSDGIDALVVAYMKDSAGVWQAQNYVKEKAPTLCSAP